MNVGEAAPGVQTPLALAFWGELAERAMREPLYRVGVLPADELDPTGRPG